jgi:3'-5' exoribonuclease
MMTRRQNDPIRTFEDGDSVSGFAYLAKMERRQDKNGRDYLDLLLKDSSDSIAAKVWSDSPALNGDYQLHDFVAYKGTVQSYRDQLQLNVRECRRATHADRQHGFDESTLIPSTRLDIDQLESRLTEILTREIDRPILRRLARETLESYGSQLREHPAAKMIHHAFRGGLLEHVVSMTELALAVCRHYAELDRDLLLLGVLYHDLGKTRELGAMPNNDYTLAGRLVGHVVMGRDLLRERCRAIPEFPSDLQLHLEHLILSHQGRLDFGSPVQPMTAEAIVLHFIDDLDSKLAQLREASEKEPALQYLTGFSRYLYTGFAPADEQEVEQAPEQRGDAPSPAQPTLDLD